MGPQLEPSQDAQRLQDLQVRKAELEAEKLTAEIHNLRRRWTLPAPYVAAILPVMAISLATWITYQNSEFKRDAENSRKEAAALRSQKGVLEQQTAAGRADLATLRGQIEPLRNEVKSLRADAVNARKETKAAQAERDRLEQEAHEIQGNLGRWRGQVIQVSGRLQSAASILLAGPLSDPVIQYSQINQLRVELQKIAAAMLAPSGSKK